MNAEDSLVIAWRAAHIRVLARQMGRYTCNSGALVRLAYYSEIFQLENYFQNFYFSYRL